MKKRYSIGFLVLTVLCLTALSGAYRLSYNYAKLQQQVKLEKERIQQEQEQAAAKEDPVVETEGEASKADGYYLTALNGYIVVYQADQKTVYEYTNIALDSLPDDVRQAIENGTVIETEEALFGFLENYSS